MSDLGNIVLILFAFLNNFENFESELPFHGMIDWTCSSESFFLQGPHIWLAWQDSQVKFNQLDFFLWGHPSRHWAMFHCMQCQYPWRDWMCILKEWNLSFSYMYRLDPCQWCTANRRGTSKRMNERILKGFRRTLFLSVKRFINH